MEKYFKKLETRLFILIIIFTILGGFLFFNKNYLSHFFSKNNPLVESNISISAFSKIAKELLLSKKEKTFLIILQNNMELRPGGGFIGSFGIVKIKDGKIIDFAVHDTANFDGRIPSTIAPPYPMAEMLHIDSWKLRDSNYSPDFAINAKKAEEFYYAGQGKEKFDGIIGINSSVLESALKILGPVNIQGMGELNAENVLLSLEKQVEVDYKTQNIAKGDRKLVINDLLGAIIEKVQGISFADKLKLAKSFAGELDRKEIQLYFKNKEIQKIVEESHWAGKVDYYWKKDYLMLSDANLGGYKSDYYMIRSVDYLVDLFQEKPIATLRVTYNHTAKQKDWMTNDYYGYLRVYVPSGAWLVKDEKINNIQIGNDLGRKYFGKKVFVPLGKTVTEEFQYYITEKNIMENYDLLFQKQSGIRNIPLTVKIKYPDGTEKRFNEQVDKDFVLGGK